MSVREYSIIILHSKLPQVPEELMLHAYLPDTVKYVAV